MLSEFKTYGYHTFGYQYLRKQDELPVQIDSFGYECADSNSYFFDSEKRPHEEGNCIFQYTLSGSGTLEHNENTYHLKEGQAFLVSIPERSKYYLPPNSSSWEFVFITFYGSYAANVWNHIITTQGPVIKCTLDEAFMNILLDHYKKACSGLNCNLTSRMSGNTFDNSTVGYRFIMELQKYIVGISNENEELSDISNLLTSTIQYMKSHLSEQLSLDDIAKHSHMTKYHFDRMFHKKTGITPWDYLTKLRMEKAMHLLVTTNKTISEIAPECGYENANYFHKVFRAHMGMSALTFRKSYNHNVHFSIEL